MVDSMFKYHYGFSNDYKKLDIFSFQCEVIGVILLDNAIVSKKYKRVFASDSCRLAGRLADTFFHISSLAGLYIMLSRVMILLPEKHRTLFMVFDACLLTIRLALGAADIIFAHIWVDQTTGVCICKDSNNVRKNVDYEFKTTNSILIGGHCIYHCRLFH